MEVSKIKIINIDASKNYSVYIDNGIISDVGKMTKELKKKYRKIAVISDDNVFPLYGDKVINSFKSEGYDVYNFIFKAGENAKSIKNLTDIISWLISNNFTRTDLIVALGGGVCGDLSGFVSSVYLRGIDYIQIPTTLLSAIDSSVGGKTAINIPEGKNLVGSFWQPSMVVCDTDTLDTLPEKAFTDGVAEAIKYGCIWDKDLFNTLCSNDWRVDKTADIIARCIEIKAEVVAVDELDMGLRQILNFGHTLGHGVEKLSNLTVTHGQGVAIGMYLITRASEAKGYTVAGTSDKILGALKEYSLPYLTSYTDKELYSACIGDKKRSGDSINLIILEEIGKYSIITLSINDLQMFISGGVS